MNVEYYEFKGGHTIPPDVADRFVEVLLSSVPMEKRTSVTKESRQAWRERPELRPLPQGWPRWFSRRRGDGRPLGRRQALYHATLEAGEQVQQQTQATEAIPIAFRSKLAACSLAIAARL